jgi:hypothetical protein
MEEMKSFARVATGAFCLAAVVCLWSAPASFGAVSCEFSPPDHLFSISATDAFTKVTRSGQQIAVDDGHQPVDCGGPPPNVHNTDLVQITHTGRSADTVDLAGGPFEPGSTNETTGISEIELQYLTPTFVDVRGTSGPDALSFAAGGINLNGDDDSDVIGAFTALLVEGRAGNDVISPQAGYSRAAPRRVMLGQSGNDTLIATPDGSIIHGGNGQDELIGGRGRDNLTGGRGSDVMRGGKRRDLIRAIDGTKDLVNCGGGLDRAKVDGIDKVRHCERLIKVKRRGPVKKP